MKQLRLNWIVIVAAFFAACSPYPRESERMAEAMAEQVRQLLSCPTDTIVRSGIENANRFSWDTMYRQIKQVYENICYNHHVQ